MLSWCSCAVRNARLFCALRNISARHKQGKTAKMSFMVFQKCCCCVDLRLGSFIIAYLSLISRIFNLIYSSIRLSNTEALVSQDSFHGGDVSFHKMVCIVTIMITVFDLLMCIALLFGLHKRLDQHLEMFYVGSFAFLVMGVIVFAVTLFRYAAMLHTMAWVLAAVEIVTKLICIYFLLVIRSYYFKMKEESDDKERLSNKDNYYAKTKPIGFAYSTKP